jgi:hypothetical protein
MIVAWFSETKNFWNSSKTFLSSENFWHFWKKFSGMGKLSGFLE